MRKFGFKMLLDITPFDVYSNNFGAISCLSALRLRNLFPGSERLNTEDKGEVTVSLSPKTLLSSKKSFPPFLHL